MAEKKNFGDKILVFREEISKQDWSPDGENVSQNYEFLSNKKMKVNVQKALVKAGLDWRVDFTDLQIMPAIGERQTQHYICKAIATISDPSDPSDEYIQWTAFGEAADTSDKAISKMQTNAFKNLIANNLLVADLTEEGESIAESMQSAKDSGKSGYDAKKEVAKEIVLKKHGEPTKTEIKTPKGGPTAIQVQVMEKILNKVKILDDVVLAPFGKADEIEQRYRAVKTNDDAAQFIIDFKGVVELQ